MNTQDARRLSFAFTLKSEDLLYCRDAFVNAEKRGNILALE